MRNDAALHARSPRGGTGRGSFFPSSLRTISTYWRSVSANASTIASTVRSAGATVASTVSSAEDERQREQVQWAGFDSLETGPSQSRRVLLLTYLNGFQVWDVEEANNVRELLSRRDGPVAFLRLQPYVQEVGEGGLKAARPLLLVVTGDASNSVTAVPGGFPGGYGGGVGSPPGGGNGSMFPTVVRFYSLRTHAYVHVLRFRSTICAVRCSSRVVAVALHAQIYCFDAVTLQNIFSVLTYPIPHLGGGSAYNAHGAMAVGPRWLAYAANQPLMATTGRVSPQHLTSSPGVSPSTSPAGGSLVAHYAKESSKHIAAGIVTLGDMGYKTLSRYCSDLLPDGATNSGSSSPSWKNGVNGHAGGQVPEPEHAGIVVVRDFVSRKFVTHFRAHTSPLSALAFDPSGTLLVTASIHGHNLNVFRLTPSSAGTGSNSGSFDAGATHVHLYKLSRGMTAAVIQDICISRDGHWVVVSSSRATTHVFAISPFGGMVGLHTHGTYPVDGPAGSTFAPAPLLPWWSSSGPVRATQQPVLPPPPPVTLSVVSRIKNGPGGWRGTVTGAAAAAAGRSNVVSGAVAAILHDGGSQMQEAEVSAGSLKEQLWVLAPSGHLLRYLLHPLPVLDAGYNNGSMAGPAAASNSACQQQGLRLNVDTLQRWDVCRRPTWGDREENIDSLAGPDLDYENGFSKISGKEGATTEEMQRRFMSNAEVQMHHARTLPVWASSKVHFHVMLAAGKQTGDEVSEMADDDLEIERFPTKVIEVRRKGLVPVKEPEKIQGQREMNVNNLPGVSALQMHLLEEGGLQDGRVAFHSSGPEIQRTSSGSSFGSEGGPFGANCGLNGFHQAYQDSPDTSAAGTPSSRDSSPPYFQDIRHGRPASLDTMELLVPGLIPTANGNYFEQTFSLPVRSREDASAASGSPPMDIPRFGRQEVGVSGVYNLSSLRVSMEEDYTNKLLLGDLHRDVVLETIEAADNKSIHCVAHVEGDEASKEPKGRVSQVFNDTYGISEGLETLPGEKGPDCWKDMEGIVPPVVRMQSLGDRSQEVGNSFCLNNSRHDVIGIEGEALASSRCAENSATVEDGESTDAQSKSEENEGEAGDDVWEGTMFPFCEED